MSACWKLLKGFILKFQTYSLIKVCWTLMKGFLLYLIEAFWTLWVPLSTTTETNLKSDVPRPGVTSAGIAKEVGCT